MVLGQPWLFSHSMRIDYIHEMGVMLQLWENGDRKGRSIFINLPLLKAPRNVMPIGLRRNCETYSAFCIDPSEYELASPGTDPVLSEVPKFMKRAVKALEIRGLSSEKPRPNGLNEDLILDSSLSMPYISEVMRQTWLVSGMEESEPFPKHIEKLK